MEVVKYFCLNWKWKQSSKIHYRKLELTSFSYNRCNSVVLYLQYLALLNGIGFLLNNKPNEFLSNPCLQILPLTLNRNFLTGYNVYEFCRLSFPNQFTSPKRNTWKLDSGTGTIIVYIYLAQVLRKPTAFSGGFA